MLDLLAVAVRAGLATGAAQTAGAFDSKNVGTAKTVTLATGGALSGADAGNYTWVAAAIGSNSASGFQLAADEPVMAVGGFNGSDPSPTLAQFQAMISAPIDLDEAVANHAMLGKQLAADGIEAPGEAGAHADGPLRHMGSVSCERTEQDWLCAARYLLRWRLGRFPVLWRPSAGPAVSAM